MISLPRIYLNIHRDDGELSLCVSSLWPPSSKWAQRIVARCKGVIRVYPSRLGSEEYETLSFRSQEEIEKDLGRPLFQKHIRLMMTFSLQRSVYLEHRLDGPSSPPKTNGTR